VQYQPVAAEHTVQEAGQRFGERLELGEDQHPLLPFGDRFADLGQPLEFAALLGRKVRFIQVLGGMIADLFQLHQHGQHQSTSRHPVGVLQSPLEFCHHPFVQRCLLLGQSAFDSHLGLGGKIRCDVRVGLQSAEDIRVHQPPQGAESVQVFRSVQPLDIVLELRCGAEQPWTAEIEDRPQIAQMVLHGRAGQHDAGARVEPFDGAGLSGRGVFDRLGFVQHDQPPRSSPQPILPPSQSVGGDHQIETGQRGCRIRGNSLQILGSSLRTMSVKYPQSWPEAFQLLPPVPDQGGGDD
jgi:hypothetical protein